MSIPLSYVPTPPPVSPLPFATPTPEVVTSLASTGGDLFLAGAWIGVGFVLLGIAAIVATSAKRKVVKK